MSPTTPESPTRAAVRVIRAAEWAAYFADLERRQRAHARRRLTAGPDWTTPVPAAKIGG